MLKLMAKICNDLLRVEWCVSGISRTVLKALVNVVIMSKTEMIKEVLVERNIPGGGGNQGNQNKCFRC